jgi:UDP-N-acetylmuramoylalanine--D-glutamate ligase
MATTHKHIAYNAFPTTTDTGSSMASILAGKLLRARNESLNESLSDFEGSSNKLELVKNIEGIDFINDSRSTNVNAVWFALESMTKPTTWIMSIDNRENLSDELLEIVEEKVKHIVMLGVYNSDIYNFFVQTGIAVDVYMNMEEAVRAAYYNAAPGDAVLFAPGTTSFGMYRTYRERGEKFKEAVAQL